MNSLFAANVDVFVLIARGLLFWSLQAAFLFGAAWLVIAIVPKKSPNFRAALWMTAFVIVPFLPPPGLPSQILSQRFPWEFAPPQTGIFC